MTPHEFPYRRALAFWAGAFVAAYVSNLFLSTAGQVTQSGWAFLFLQLAAPAWFFLFAWAYFRSASCHDWHHRFSVAGSWIALWALGNAMLAGPVYGAPWQAVLASEAWTGYAVIAGAILAAALASGTRER